MNGPLALILMGAPGAGKSTQAQMLRARYGLTVLSTGQIVRQEIRKGTALGRLMAPIAEEPPGNFARLPAVLISVG